MIDNIKHISHELIKIAEAKEIIEGLDINFDDFFILYKERSPDSLLLTEEDLILEIREAGIQQIGDLGPEDTIMMGAIFLSEDLFNPEIVSGKMVKDAEKIVEQEDFELYFTELFEIFKEKNSSLGHFEKPDFLKIILETGDYRLGEGDEFEFYDAVIAGINILFGKELSL